MMRTHTKNNSNYHVCALFVLLILLLLFHPNKLIKKKIIFVYIFIIMCPVDFIFLVVFHRLIITDNNKININLVFFYIYFCVCVCV